MRKFALLAIIMFVSIFTSCTEPNCGIDLDKTLAGSISFYSNIIVVEASYDGVLLDKETFNGRSVQIDKLTDSDVSLLCYTTLGDEDLALDIPYIPVFGVPYRATLNYSSPNAQVRYGEVVYYPTATTINGWVTEIHLDPTRCSPVIPEYIFDIKLDFTFEDGTVLSVRVTPKE